MNSSIKSGALISYISIIINIGISLIYTPWMIKEIGQSNYGIYSLIMAFISYFLLDFGLGSAISRFLAKYRAEKDEGQIKRMVSVAYSVFMFLSIGIFLILSVLYFFLSDIFVKLTPTELEILKNAYLIAGFFSIVNFSLKPVDGMMMAYEYFVKLKTLDLIQRLGTVFLIFIVLLAGGGIYELIFINGAVALLVSIMKWKYTLHHSNVVIKIGYFEKPMAKQLFSFSVWILIINIAQRLRLNLIPSVLGIMTNTVEIAIFALAMNLEGLVYNFSHALNGLFIPKVSRMVANGTSKETISGLMIKVGRFQLIVIGFILMGLLGLGKSFINLWVGEDFHKTYYVFFFLVCTNIVTLTQQIGTTLSYVENEIKYNSIISVSCSVLSLIFSVLLAPKYGAIGCGAAFCISSILSMIAINIFYKKKLELDVGKFFRNCHAKILPITFPLFVLLIMADNMLDISSWEVLFLSASIFTIIYFCFVYLMALNQEEKILLHSVINGLIQKYRN